MFPYSPESAEDEPTMTDLRGVMPARRPPVDATVLDEPTSEVPVIKPPADPASADETDPEAATIETAAIETAATDHASPATGPEPVGPAPGGTGLSIGPDLTPTPEPITDATLEPITDATAEPITDATAEPVTGGEPAGPAPAAFAETGEDPTGTVEPAPAPRLTEMSKLTWRPAPFRPHPTPRPSPVTPLAEAAPVTPLAEAAPVTPLAEAAPVTPLAEPEPATLLEPPFVPEPPAPATGPGGPAEAAESAPAGRPGDVVERPIALWSQEAADRLRGQWRELQGEFFDDPDAAVAGAKDLVTEAVHELADTLLAAQDALDPYRGSVRVDTETMRVAMRRYREFMERVLAL
jgi:hypothetical protein